jgi:LysR family transcriptional regulator for bpeEF and oprC
VAGLGIMQMAAYMVEPLLASGALELVLEDWTSAPLPMHVVYPHNRHLSAKVRVFVEWVAELFARHPALQLQPGR